MSTGVCVCVCGCLRDTHQHYNAGTYCGRCGMRACPRYRRAGAWWRRWRP